jgi:ubiquinone/menaquinone biosynthesis C-methylase UbiE
MNKRNFSRDKNYFDMKNFHEALNIFCAKCLLNYFSCNGVDISCGANIPKIELFNKLKIVNVYKAFFSYLIDFLELLEYVKVENDDVTFIKESECLEPYKEDILVQSELFAFLKNCIEKYSEILTGKLTALTLLYPNGDIEYLENLLNLAPLPSLLVEQKGFLLSVIKNLSENKGIDILEVGGGSGELTWLIAPQINKVNYLFTDVSRFFAMRAQEKSEALTINNMRFGIYDLTKKASSQNLVEDSFDIIVACNVIHVIPDIVSCLKNLKNLLIKGGQLILLENSYIYDWETFIWGMLPTWWITDNLRYQNNSPLLDSSTWKKVLTWSEFKNIKFYPNQYNDADKTFLIFAENS